ncbi:MAG: T9SS type A sorting domain-containing protein [Bacteroidota bacterium]|nr:T9SS type A sorting domain-containing protein [Bacteroidota bacterium]
MKTLILLLAMTFLLSHKIYSQWESLNGPLGGDVVCLASDGSNFYAGSNGSGIYKSIDSGLNWFAVNSGLENLFINSLIYRGSVLYASTVNAKVFKSNNGGTNWSPLASFEFGEKRSLTLSVSGNIMLASYSRVFYSYNYGNTWFSVIGLAETELKQTSAICNLNFYAARFGEGIYRSTNVGYNWSIVNTGLSNHFVNSMVTIDNILYACTEGGIFKWSDVSLNWNSINSGLTELNIISISGEGNNFFVASKGGGVFRSIDGGNSWVKTNLQNKNVKSIFHSGTLTFAGVFNEGIMRSTNSGNNWVSIDTFGFKPYGNALSVLNNFIYYATNENGIFKSSDLGETWSDCNNGFTSQHVRKISFGENFQYAAFDGQGVFMSSDQAGHWIPVNLGRTNYYLSAIFGQNEKVLTGTEEYEIYNEVMFSSNSGFNWNPLIFTELAIKTLYIKNDDFYIGGRSKVFAGIFKTTNHGTNWRRVLSDLPLYMTSYDSIFYAGASMGVHVSTNNGNNWTSISNGLPGTFYKNVNCVVKYNNILFASLYDEFSQYGVYRSDNHGASWYSFNEGFNSIADQTSLVVMDDYLYASTYSHGLWRRPITITNMNLSENNITYGFHLYQNYPNPFNPTTKIKFDISKSSFVKLIIFDVLGKEIKNILNEQLNTRQYEVSFDASEYPSGIYFYKLETENFSQTKRMLIIK